MCAIPFIVTTAFSGFLSPGKYWQDPWFYIRINNTFLYASLEWKLGAQNKEPNYFSSIFVKFGPNVIVCIPNFL